MRLVPPPPAIRLPPQAEHAPLLRALALARGTVTRHERALALALEELGDIDLPAGAPNAQDRVRVQAAGPLYFAAELERAGVIPIAERIAGLFASGAITQPLGPAARLLHAFWRGRQQRLTAEEREAIFARVIEPGHFDRLMRRLCEAIVAQADGSDVREDVGLATAAQVLAEFLAQRCDAMATLAVRDLVDTLNDALQLLRDRLLQVAFGVTSLWTLLAVLPDGAGGADGTPQQHAERGRAGQTVLGWLADHFMADAQRLDPARPDDLEVISAAQRWLMLAPREAATPSPVAPALPIAA